MIRRFQDIAEMNPKALELLEAAGYVDTESVSGKSIAEITEEVIKANSILSIVEETPTATTVQQWLAPVEHAFGNLEVKQQRVKSEYLIEPGELLATTYATPLSQAFIDKHELDLASLPTADARFISEDEAAQHEFTLLDDKLLAASSPVPFSPDDLDEGEEESDDLGELAPLPELEQTMIQKVQSPLENLEQTIPQTVKFESTKKDDLEKTLRQTISASETTNEEDPAERAIKESENRLAEADKVFSDPIFTQNSASLQKEKILSMDTFRERGSHVSPLQNAAGADLTKSVKKETNEGIDPSSRRYVRGVLHTQRAGFRVSSVAFILFNLCILAGIILTPLVLVNKEKYSWAVWAPLFFVVGILVYFIFARKAGCPICNQKQYRPKACLKHRNAHHWPIIGYMLPTALHALTFKWFRCIFCGTSVRLKE